MTLLRWMQLVCPGESFLAVGHGRPTGQLGVEDDPDCRGPPGSLTPSLCSFPSRGHWPMGPGPVRQCCAPRQSPLPRSVPLTADPIR